MARPRKEIPEGKRRSRTFGKTPKDQAGRPVGFRDEMIDQAKALVARGFTDVQIAGFFDCNPSTLWRWKQAVPNFGRAFLRGEVEQQAVLESSMFHRATGYSHPAVKIFPPSTKVVGRGKNRKVVAGEPVIVKYEEHFPPDPQAARLLLQKLDPGAYSTRMIHAGDPKQPVIFNMQNRPPKEKR